MRFHEREQTGLETYVGKKMRKGYVFDGWARLASSVIQHAFIEASDLCKQKNKSRISKKEKDSISAKIDLIRNFLSDPKNPYVNYLEVSGHVLDIEKMNSIIDGFEGGKECIRTLKGGTFGHAHS